ncbi:efflux RND transporter periplasmic adaptor subunit [Polymorphum gilvum]|uniref:Efflux transporter, RND family, MFP subunit n=1 Tax=Polymorphum gilvum (strain LMG 25793 / CGMCC 1.9160 / SL003B-26A1) TaxID=991905 RepID=F2J591_POLGS|nr:efflux RND transporter periplasmic adaptor subunit [Polymorphum gilvum]ADZ71150.1 Efflux transporter, RND family, MFP subunit [Polymorphum gilvum SL003B-26A1]
MRLKASYFLAIGLAGAIGMWMWTGTVVIGGRGDSAEATPPPAERQEQAGDRPFRVKVARLVAEERNSVLTVRGSTQAEAKVAVRAETAGRVAERPVREGARVAAGDTLCVLDRGAREAGVLEATAAEAQARLDYEAARQLNAKGFAAETRVAALRAAHDATKARLHEAELELERTIIRAPIGGIVESPMAYVGDHLKIGDPCGTVVDSDPMIAIGQVSELSIGLIAPGMPAEVDLVDGTTLSGSVRYIAPSANPDTRTFRIEVELPNPDGRARDGTTALTRLPLAAEKAHKVSPAILTLDDAGRVGVRTVDADNRARFVPVRVLGGEADGVWLSGLPEMADVIVVGQDYVGDGEAVEPVFETVEAGR